MTDKKLFPATIMPDSDWWQDLWPNPEAVLQALGIEQNMHVVDLCCGDGLFTKSLCELTKTGKVWAVDLDAKLLAEAEKACNGRTNFQAIFGDARELPNQIDKPTDFVFMANTFHGVPEKSDLSKAVHQSLKKEGKFVIVNWHQQPRETTTVLNQPRGPDTKLRMTPEMVKAIVEPAGFLQEKVIDVGPYHYASIFMKQ